MKQAVEEEKLKLWTYQRTKGFSGPDAKVPINVYKVVHLLTETIAGPHAARTKGAEGLLYQLCVES